MPRPLSIALIASLCFALTTKAEDKASPAVKKILDKAVAKVRTNRTEFDKANKKPLDEARAELQDLSTKLIKDGKTEEAGGVLKQVGTLEVDVMRMANAPAPVAGGGAAPQKPLLDRIAGKWDMGNWHMVIEQDGSCKQVEKGNGIVSATGQFVLKDAGTAEMKLTNGWGWQCSMPMDDDKLVVFNWNPAGQRQAGGKVLERVK